MIALVLIFGISLFAKSKDYGEEVDIQNFVQTISSKVNKLNNLEEGSEEVFSYAIPSKIDKICFASQDNFDKTKDPELASIYSSEKNLYIFPGNSYNIGKLYLEKNPVCISENLNIKLVKTKLGVNIVSEETIQECNNILFNKEDNIDILFIPENYNSIDEFTEDAKEYTNVLLSKEPISSNKNLFNVYSLNDLPEIDCTKDYVLMCDLTSTQKIALDCPHDFIVVLSKSSKLSGLRSTARPELKFMSISTGDNKLVMVHEFGHALAKLADEYYIPDFDDLKSLDNSPNCDISPCDKWNKNGCYETCSSNSYYKPSEGSIMEKYGFLSKNEFNDPSKKAILKNLEAYK